MYKVKVRNEAEVSDIDVYIDSGIEHGIAGYMSVKGLREQLSTQPFEKVILHVNSDGGDLFEGLAIYNYLNELKQSGHGVEAIIEGICASSANVAVMAADKISMYPTSYMYIHEPMICEMLTSEEALKVSEFLSDITEKVIKIYTDRTGLNPEAIRAIMKKESWLNAESCMLLGLCDEVVDVAKAKPEGEVRLENRIRDSQGLHVENTYKRPDTAQEAISNMAKVINKKRGYAV